MAEVVGYTLSDIRNAVNKTTQTVENLILENGDSSAEVVAARTDYEGKTFATLGERSDYEAQRITESEEALQTKRDKADKIGSGDLDISSDAVKIQPIHLSDAVKAQMAGTTPVSPTPAPNSITPEYLAFNSVTRKRSSFFERASSNLFDVDEEVDPNGYYDLFGNYSSSVSGYGSTGFIEVMPGTEYYTNLNGFITFWNVNMKFISSVNNSGTLNFTPPSGTAYANFSLELAKRNLKFLVIGSSGQYEKPLYKDPKLVIDTTQISGEVTKEQLEIIETIPSLNLLDKSKLNRSGYYNYTTGAFVASTEYFASDFIPVEVGATYAHKRQGHTTFWDANKKFISGVNGTASNPFTVPTNVKYAVITVYATDVDIDMLIKGSSLPTQYIPYESKSYALANYIQLPNTNVNSNLSGITAAFLGDSITFGLGASNPYHAVIASRNNMTALNYGISGTRIAVVEGQSNAMCDRYVSLPNTANMVVVFGGTNDYASNVPIGDINSTDKTTFYGALNVLCLGLIQKYPGKRIGLITPMMRRNVDYAKMRTYVDAMIAIGEKYSIPVLNLFKTSGLYPTDDIINTTFFYNADGLHPNNAGHETISRPIESFLKSI